jgi:hypothetical protein
MSAIDDLNTMLANLGALQQNASASDRVQIVAAMAQVQGAIMQLGAQDILATLPNPNSQNGQAITAMIGKMNAAANSINNQVQDVTTAVQIATGFANLVTSVLGGNIANAMTAVQSLAAVLP